MKTAIAIVNSVSKRLQQAYLWVMCALATTFAPALAVAQNLPTLPQPPESNGNNADPGSAIGKLMLKYGGYIIVGVALTGAVLAAYSIVHNMNEYRKGRHDFGDFAGHAAMAVVSLIVCSVFAYYGYTILQQNQGFLTATN